MALPAFEEEATKLRYSDIQAHPIHFVDLFHLPSAIHHSGPKPYFIRPVAAVNLNLRNRVENASSAHQSVGISGEDSVIHLH